MKRFPVWFLVLSVKCYLIFCKDNEVKKFRLYGFGEKDLEKLLAVLREKQMKYMEIEKRFALVETYEKNASEALFSERKREHSSTVCTDLADDKTVKGEYLLPPKQLIAKEKNTVRKIGLIFLGRICARRILIGGEFIQIGEDTYTYTGTESIRLTSPPKGKRLHLSSAKISDCTRRWEKTQILAGFPELFWGL